ncbi:MAG: hypothetical protein HYR96_05345 [Deltaproteobacteria bacterium]|nr:hypothetical protein [Deltaproteobacteria bacterium]MBI3294224.1 hypothetical protein [Deltaproteobacteria bacterium]
MKKSTKSSITLPPKELALVQELQQRLKAKSKVEVIRRGLMGLKEKTDRDFLKEAYATAARSVRESVADELHDLEHLIQEGLKDK